MYRRFKIILRNLNLMKSMASTCHIDIGNSNFSPPSVKLHTREGKNVLGEAIFNFFQNSNV